MKNIKSLYLLLVGLVCLPLQAADHFLKSPDGKLLVEIGTDGQLSYTIKRDGQVLLDNSPIGLVLEDKILGEDAKVSRANRRTLVKETIVSPHYRCSSFDVVY